MNIVGISGLPNSVSFKRRMFPGLDPRCYRIAQGLDSAAALLSDRGVVAAAAEERFRRVKGTEAFPIGAIRYCLAEACLTIDDIQVIAHGFCYEPYRDALQEVSLIESQRFDEVYSRAAQLRCLEEHLPGRDWASRFVEVPHHLAHAASAFYLSGMNEALILVSDGMGEAHSATVAVGSADGIRIVEQIPGLHSLGLLYSVVTHHLGFEFGCDEYKIMGLAPYGNSRRYFDRFMKFVHLKDNGTYTIPVLFKNVTDEDKEVYRSTREVLIDTFGPARLPDGQITQHEKDVAAGLQAVLQTALLHVLKHFKRATGQNKLCFAGGVALNCTANGVIKRSRLFKDLFIQPAAGDDGTSLGAALYAQRVYEPERRHPRMTVPLWGPAYSCEVIQQMLSQRNDCEYVHFPSWDVLVQQAAALLSDGRILGWFQGRMEFGPRALGNRSILGDPRSAVMRDRINAMVKKREEFRPFAPAVTTEAAHEVFEINPEDGANHAHMILTAQVRATFRDRLPAVTHVDGSARIQVVLADHNWRFWSLLNAFGKLSGIPVLLNTSFNVRGQPIVCTPSEALDTALGAGLDALVLGDYLVVGKSRSQDL